MVQEFDVVTAHFDTTMLKRQRTHGERRTDGLSALRKAALNAASSTHNSFIVVDSDQDADGIQSSERTLLRLHELGRQVSVMVHLEGAVVLPQPRVQCDPWGPPACDRKDMHTRTSGTPAGRTRTSSARPTCTRMMTRESRPSSVCCATPSAASPQPQLYVRQYVTQ